MKASSNVALRKIAGENILVPVGEMINSFHGVMSLNGSGLLLWEALQTDRTEEELVEIFLANYDVDQETAASDIREFLTQLERANILVK